MYNRKTLMLIESIMELLKDGKWHDICSIAEELNQSEENVLKIIKFCEEFDFMLHDKTLGRTRVDKEIIELL
jgi:hypothetical protein